MARGPHLLPPLCRGLPVGDQWCVQDTCCELSSEGRGAGRDSGFPEHCPHSKAEALHRPALTRERCGPWWSFGSFMPNRQTEFSRCFTQRVVFSFMQLPLPTSSSINNTIALLMTWTGNCRIIPDSHRQVPVKPSLGCSCDVASAYFFLRFGRLPPYLLFKKYFF